MSRTWLSRVLGGLVWVSAASGCSRSELERAPAPRVDVPRVDVKALPPEVPTHTLVQTVQAQHPIRASWVELERTETRAVLAVELHRVVPMDLPFTVSVELPSGVTLLDGRTRFTVPPNLEGGTVREVLLLALKGTPSDDAMLEVEGSTGVMGFHARVPYRFGRPEPEAVPPAATGPGVRRMERFSGATVPITPNQPQR